MLKHLLVCMILCIRFLIFDVNSLSSTKIVYLLKHLYFSIYFFLFDHAFDQTLDNIQESGHKYSPFHNFLSYSTLKDDRELWNGLYTYVQHVNIPVLVSGRRQVCWRMVLGPWWSWGPALPRRPRHVSGGRRT